MPCRSRLLLCGLAAGLLSGWLSVRATSQESAGRKLARTFRVDAWDIESAARRLLALTAADPETQASVLLELVGHKPHSRMHLGLRAAAAVALRRLGIPVLARALHAAHPEVRSLAARVLVLSPDHPGEIYNRCVMHVDRAVLSRAGLSEPVGIEDVIEATGSADPTRRAVAEALLTVHDGPAIRPDRFARFRALVRALKDPRPGVRRGAALGLRHHGDDGLDALARAAKDPDASVRMAAVESLGELRTSARPREIEAALDDPEPRVVVTALHALARRPVRTQAVARAILAHLRSAEEPGCRAAAARALGTVRGAPWPEPALVPPLLGALRDPSPAVRTRAAEALGGIGATGRSVRSALAERLEDPACEVRAAAVAALGETPDTKGDAEALVRALADSEPEVRKAAVDALASGDFDVGVVAPALARALEDPDAHVRTVAAAALSRLDRGTESTCPALIAALEDPEYWVRMHAVTTLGKVGPAARAAVPAILALLEAEDRPLRLAAARALVGVGEPAIPHLVRALQTAEADRRSPYEAALARHGRAAVDHLEPLLLSGQSRRRDVALAMLLRLGPAAGAAVPTLIANPRIDSGAERVRTARVLGRIGPPAIPDLVRACEAREDRTRRVASLALAYAAREYGSAVSAAEPIFLHLLGSEDPEQARLGAMGLVDLGLDPSVGFARVRAALAADRTLPPALTAEASPHRTREEAARALFPVLGASHPGHRLLAALALARLGGDAAAVLDRALDSDLERTRVAAAWALALGDRRAIRPAIERGYGIDVVDRVTRYFFPRELWARTHARSLRPGARGPALAVVIRALARYPARLVRRHVASIRLAQSLSVDGLPYGGTLHQANLYLATGPRPNASLARAFHHEFSSALFRSNPFPAREWAACNPPKFRYGRGGRHAIRSGAVGFGNAVLFARGFLTPYACADLENDFNVFSETVLGDPIRARALIDRYPRLKAKWGLWIRFYGERDASFTADRILGP